MTQVQTMLRNRDSRAQSAFLCENNCANVSVRIEGRLGRITLNRPTASNALNLSMCEAISNALVAWKHEDRVDIVLFDHAPGTRGFCVDGSLPMLSEAAKRFGTDADAFIRAKYQLLDLIAEFPKPHITILDGVASGVGVGLAALGSHQVVTERTVLSLPETGLGFFPGNGATWFLPKLSGQLATWLALTGARLNGEEMLSTGLATHFCLSNEVERLKRGLAQEGLPALNRYRSNSESLDFDNLSEIKHLFAGDAAGTILRRLESGSPWAKSQATKLRAKSPLSTKIALRQIRTGAYLCSPRQAFRIEYRIASRLIFSQDFHEGVRAGLVDKDHLPYWRPSILRKISNDMVAKYFAPMGDRELRFVDT